MRSQGTSALMMLVSVIAGCATSQSIEPSSQPTTPVSAGLAEGDVIEIKVFREPDLGGVYRLSEEGEVSLPLIGKVSFLGKEATQVAREIKDRLADGYLKQPEVTVFVRENNSRQIHVLGQVNKAGTFKYVAGMSVIQAITNAGGFTSIAATNSVRVTRLRIEKPFIVRVGDIRKGDAPNFELSPGDIVFVPEAIF